MSFFKRFSFFTQRDARDHGVPPNATCVACARTGAAGGLGHTYAGTDAGVVVVLAPPPASGGPAKGGISSIGGNATSSSSSGSVGLASLGAFSAHAHRVVQIAYADRLDQIVTLGLEEPGVSSATVKVWDARALRERAAAVLAAAAAASAGARAGGPQQQQQQQQQQQAQPAARPPSLVPLAPLRVQRVFGGAKRPESEATCLAATEAVAPLLTAAVGLANGGVFVFQGDTSAATGPAGGAAGGAAPGGGGAGGGGGGGGGGAAGLPSPRGERGGPGASSSHAPAPAPGLQCVAKLAARPETGDLWAVTRMFFAMAAPPYQQRQEQFRLLYEQAASGSSPPPALGGGNNEKSGGASAATRDGTGKPSSSSSPAPTRQQQQQPQQQQQQSSHPQQQQQHHARPDLLRVDASALWSGVPGESLVADGPRQNALAERQERLHLYVVTESQTLCFRVHDGSRSVLEPRGLGAAASAAVTLRPAEPRDVGGGGGAGAGGFGTDPAAAAAAAAVSATPPLLVAGRDDALYDYTLDTRAGCTVFAGRKLWLSTALGRYIVLVTAAATGGGGGGGQGGAGAGAGDRAAAAGVNDDGADGAAAALTASPMSTAIAAAAGSSSQACTLTFLDVRHKLIAGSFVLPSPVRHVLAPSSSSPSPSSLGGACGAPGGAPAALASSSARGASASAPYPSHPALSAPAAAAPPALAVVLASGRALCFYEAPHADRVDALLRRSLHRTALDVARSAGADAASLAAIHRTWGDHLYARGEFDAAMAQYLETPPPWLEPSYVVRRFLDAQRIALLARYLGSLHAKGLAGPDHTTLLLSCYAKLKDVAKLDAFVNQPATGGHHAQPQPQPQQAQPQQQQQQQQQQGQQGQQQPQPHRRVPSGPSGGAAAAAAATAGGDAAGGGGGEAGLAGDKASAVSATALASAGPSPSAAGDSGGGGDLPYDAETAFRVLRGAGYYEHALTVARRAGDRVDWALSVLLEDLAAHDRALQFVEALPRPQRAEALRRYGRPLVAARLEDVTRLLMDLCVAPPPSAAPGPAQHVASAADFAHLFADRPVALTLLCEYVLNSAPGADGAGPAPPPGGGGGGQQLQQLQQQQLLQQQQQQQQGRGGGGGGGGHIGSGGGNGGLRALYHTLLELYLSDEQDEQADAEELHEQQQRQRQQQQQQQQQQRRASPSATRRDKARELLARGWQPHMQGAPAYDPQHALVLCRLHGFSAGLVFLYDRLRLPRELLRVHVAAGDHAAVLAACVEHGDAVRGGDPQLWADALDYLCAAPPPYAAAASPASPSSPPPPPPPPEAFVREVLRRVEIARALSPLAVLQALARNPTLPVSLVRDYVARELERDARAAEADRAAVARLAGETAALRAEAARLRTRPRVFQNSRCAASGAPLELPVAHFMCGHSFNLRSLGDTPGDRECPLCAPELARALDVRRHLRRGAGEQDAFFRELREARADGFGVVAEHFGRGLMNCTTAAMARDGAGGDV